MSRPGVLREVRRLSGDAGLVSLGQIVSYAYPLVSIPLLSRVLGIEGLGIFIVTLAAIQLVLVWTDFGFGFSALRRIAVAGSTAERQAVSAATITAKLALWAIGSLVLLVVVLLVPSMQPYFFIYVVGLLMSVGGALYPMWYLQGTGRLKLYALLTGGTRVVALVGLVLTVRSADQLGLAVFWQFAPQLLSAVLCWAVLTAQNDVKLRLSTLAHAIEAVKDSLPLFVSTISTGLMSNSSSILLGQLAGYRQVGLFGPADRMTSAIYGVLVAVEQSMMPRLTAAHERPQEGFHRKLILGGLVGSYGLAGLALIVIAPVLVPWYLGADFADAVPVTQLMGLATIIVGFTGTMSVDLIAAGRAKVVSVVMTAGVCVHLILAALGAMLWGAEGVAVAICTTQLLMGVAMGYAIRQGPQRRPRHLRTEGDFAFATSTMEQNR